MGPPTEEWAVPYGGGVHARTPGFLPGIRAIAGFGVEGGWWRVSPPRGRGGGWSVGGGVTALGHNGHRGLKVPPPPRAPGGLGGGSEEVKQLSISAQGEESEGERALL